MHKTDITLTESQKQVAAFLEKRGWMPKDAAGRLYTLAHMTEELGEVARCISHLESTRKDVMNTKDKELIDNLQIELGDVLYHVFKLASAYNLDVADIFSKTMAKNLKKFPEEKFGKEQQSL